MTPADHKQRVSQAIDGFYDSQERERLGQRKKTQYIGSERSEQAKLAAWLDQHNILWLHPPNEGKRTAYGHTSMLGQGMKAGAPDVLIFSRPPEKTLAGFVARGSTVCRGVAIELKRVSSKATVSVNQLEWLEALRAQGWLARVCMGAAESIRWLESLGFGS